MIHLVSEEGDAADFVTVVDTVLHNVATKHAPPELILIKIDNWFGPKWLRFSGKILGAMGVWKQCLTVPPFVPNRVVWQRRFSVPTYEEPPGAAPIHIAARSEQALARRISEVAPGAALIWFSGASEANGRAAIMAYIPVPDSYQVWYAGFALKDTWKPSVLKEISADELAVLSGFQALGE